MAIKKSELYSSLWQSCDELRGSMDASQYKDYVLILLFVKYVSDKYAGKPKSLIQIPEGGSFQDMVKIKNDKEIGDKMNKIVGKLASENDLKGVIDVADFNDDSLLGKDKEMVDRLTNLIGIFENPALDFSQNKADGDDLLGDAYEYLMRHFATESGKSKGQFYTPAEVSLIMSKVIGVSTTTSKDTTIYDPTCGSGSLLLKAADQSEVGITIYGQEKDNATVALANMNMILHGHPTADIRQDNTLSKPFFKNSDGSLKTFDFVVANPPFSTKSWSNGFDPLHDEYRRFEDGIPPVKNGDYAFFLHILKSLKHTGKGAVILPHGVLFRGNAEADIRRSIVKKGYIKGIIGLPANLFYGTGIPACIIVLDKEHAPSRKGIFMIDASQGFMKDGNKNRLRQQDIQKIVDVFTEQMAVPYYSRMVSTAEIETNDYNLNLPRYIESGDKEDIQDIEAHLHGGIPIYDIDNLQAYWDIFPTLRSSLFADSSRSGYRDPLIQTDSIRDTISQSDEFKSYKDNVAIVFDQWKDYAVGTLDAIEIDAKPKQLISELSEHLLDQFADVELTDKYDIYQILMSYWAETFQDDLYMIAIDGWKPDIREVLYDAGKNKGKPKKGEWTSDLIPKDIAISQYFAKEQQAIDNLQSEVEELTSKLTELEEEHSGEDGMLEEVKNDAGNVTISEIKSKLKEYKDNPDYTQEYELLSQYLEIDSQVKEKNKEIKTLEKELDLELLKKYKTLTEAEVKELVIKHKWMATIQSRIMAEIDRVSSRLSNRIKELVERYQKPMPVIAKEVGELEGKVEGHLVKMGFKV